MMASNHIVVGATIGASIANPWLAAPVAIGSHFIMDALPHFGYEGAAEKGRFKNVVFKSVILADLILVPCIFLVLLFSSRPELCLFALLGYSPDFMWLYEFIFRKQIPYKKRISMRGLMARWHAGIQHLEHPLGIIVEIFVFVGTSYLLIDKL